MDAYNHLASREQQALDDMRKLARRTEDLQNAIEVIVPPYSPYTEITERRRLDSPITEDLQNAILR